MRPAPSPRVLQAEAGPVSSASADASSRSGWEKTGDMSDRPLLPGGEPEAQGQVEIRGQRGLEQTLAPQP